MVVLSVTDYTSFKDAEDFLEELFRAGDLLYKAVVLVGNKTDLVRAREVPIDGKIIQAAFSVLNVLALQYAGVNIPIGFEVWRENLGHN